MNSPTRVRAILEAAKEKDFLGPGDISPAFNRTLNTANRILQLFAGAGENGLSNEQLVARTELNITTARVYTKLLRDLGYLDARTEKVNGAPIVYSLKRERVTIAID
jgi:hypothetical protein